MGFQPIGLAFFFRFHISYGALRSRSAALSARTLQGTTIKVWQVT